jgi:phosphoglycerate dehydrogenase-like enzyme
VNKLEEPARREKDAICASPREARVWMGPAERLQVLAAIIEAGGTRQASVDDANVIIWCSEDSDDASFQLLRQMLHPRIEWVQLDSTGVEDWIRLGIVDQARVWTRADYGPAVAEQVLGFLVAACRRFPQYARASEWGSIEAVNLADQTVGFLGAGRIVVESVERLKPFGASILTVSDPVVKIDGVDAAYAGEQLSEVLRASDHVVIALPLTDRTRGLIGSKALGEMRSSAWLHNVGRGQVVDTNALVAALAHGQIAGACLDTTDPEPLPADNPLWKFENVLLTQHTANPLRNVEGMYAAGVGRNVKRYCEGAELVGVIDLERGY